MPRPARPKILPGQLSLFTEPAPETDRDPAPPIRGAPRAPPPAPETTDETHDRDRHSALKKIARGEKIRAIQELARWWRYRR